MRAWIWLMASARASRMACSISACRRAARIGEGAFRTGATQRCRPDEPAPRYRPHRSAMARRRRPRRSTTARHRPHPGGERRARARLAWGRAAAGAAPGWVRPAGSGWGCRRRWGGGAWKAPGIRDGVVWRQRRGVKRGKALGTLSRPLDAGSGHGCAAHGRRPGIRASAGARPACRWDRRRRFRAGARRPRSPAGSHRQD